jgi:hypothetical protein
MPWSRWTVSEDELWVRRPTVEPVQVLRTDGATVGWAFKPIYLRTFYFLLDEDGRPLFDWAFVPLVSPRLRRSLTKLGWPVEKRPDLLRTWGR